MKKTKSTVLIFAAVLLLCAWCCHTLGFLEPAGMLLIIVTVLLCRAIKTYAKNLSRRNVNGEQG